MHSIRDGIDRNESPATVFRRSQGSLSAFIDERLWAASAGYYVCSDAGLSLAEEDLPEAHGCRPLA